VTLANKLAAILSHCTSTSPIDATRFVAAQYSFRYCEQCRALGPKLVDPSSTLVDGSGEGLSRVTHKRRAVISALQRRLQTARHRLEIAMDSERYFNQQIIERYRKLLEVVSDRAQRRQIMNLLEDEEDRARDLRRSKCRVDLSQAA
jgi:hypothetical protein